MKYTSPYYKVCKKITENTQLINNKVSMIDRMEVITMIQEIFPSGLNSVVEKHTIPRLLRKNEKLNLFRKYYFPEFDQKLKCTAIEEHDGFIFYFLTNDLYQHVLSFPISYECYTFTLDKYDIMSRNIVNDDHVYRGYQLRWWFHKHKFIKKYKNFIKLLDKVKDDNIYSVSGILEHGKYVECKFNLKYNRRD